MTALQRLADHERGWTVSEVGAIGISKEGSAHWVLGAVDDRVAVVAPGGAYGHDTAAILEAYRTDWNCGDVPFLPSEAREALHEVLRLFDWVVSTPAGQEIERSGAPVNWFNQIHARHVVVSGDLGLSGQHDWLFPLFAENSALSHFKHPSWRYVRAPDGTGLAGKPPYSVVGLSLLPHVADLLITNETRPSTPKLEIDERGRALTIRAQVDLAPGLESAVQVLSAFSSDRAARDPQEWTATNMTPMVNREGWFESTLAPAPIGKQVVFMVIAAQKVKRAPLTYLRSSSTLPQVRFELPKYNCSLPRWR